MRKSTNIEKIQKKFFAMHITNEKLRFDIFTIYSNNILIYLLNGTGSLLNDFGIK